MKIALQENFEIFFMSDNNIIHSDLVFFSQTILTRKNTVNGIRYKDDPTIFGWETINEPPTSHLEACQFVAEDHTTHLCLRISVNCSFFDAVICQFSSITEIF